LAIENPGFSSKYSICIARSIPAVVHQVQRRA
jgi:hypothetical protein